MDVILIHWTSERLFANYRCFSLINLLIEVVLIDNLHFDLGPKRIRVADNISNPQSLLVRIALRWQKRFIKYSALFYIVIVVERDRLFLMRE